MRQQLYDTVYKLANPRTPTEQSGKLGNFAATVKVPNRTNYVYVRLSDNTVAECWNTRVPPIPNLNVFVDINPRKKTELMVTDIMLDSYPRGTIEFVGIPSHGETHTWPEYDTAYINYRQVLPLRVTSAGGLSVQVNGGWYLDASGSANWYAGETVSLSSYVPSRGAKTVTVSLSPTGSLTYTEGSIVEQNEFSWLTQTPTPPSTDYPLAAVRLAAGRSVINDNNNSTNDIQDLRFVPVRASAGSLATWGGITGNLSDQTDLWGNLVEITEDISGINSELATKVEEAPIDGNQYARKDGGWVEVEASGAQVIDDVTPQIDGSGSVFTLIGSYAVASVYWNGQRLYEEQYADVTGSVVLDFIPEISDTLVVLGTSSAGIISLDKVAGVDTAGSSKYYGTDASGTPGFHALPFSTVEITSIVAAASTTTSATYVDHDATNSKVTLTKQNDDTDILIEIAVSIYSTETNTGVSFGINDGTNDHDVCIFFINLANVHQSAAGYKKISGLAAGSYTFTLRWRRSSGGGTLTTNNGDYIGIKAQEVA
jgi:hypothetical protein